MNRQQTVKGFTIIEVVLVLAIGGLILLMALVAWPALQSGQRDGARKGDVTAVAAAVSTYMSSNRGRFPANGETLGNYATNVSANTVNLNIIPFRESVSVEDGDVTVVTGATCDIQGETGDTATHTLKKGTTRQFIVVTRLEASGGSAFCHDS